MWAQFTTEGQPVYPGYGLGLYAGGNLARFLEEKNSASEEAGTLCSPAHLPSFTPPPHLPHS